MLRNVERTETAWRLNGGNRGKALLRAMKLHEGADIHIRDTVAVSEAKGIAVQKMTYAPQTPARGRGLASVHQRYLPRFGAVLKHLHSIAADVERHIGHVQVVIGKVLLEHVTLVAAADDEVTQTMTGIDLHDVPQDGPPADFNHRFGSE